MGQSQLARVVGGHTLEEEGGHVSGVGAQVAEAEIAGFAEREIVQDEVGVTPGTEDGDDASREWRGEEQGHELGDEAHA